MIIMIAGPYRHGSKDPEVWRNNLKQLNIAAYQVFEKGHIPVIGVNMALPIIEEIGMKEYESIMMPISLALAEKCDAVLRIGGISDGADEEVEIFRKKSLPVYFDLDRIPSK